MRCGSGRRIVVSMDALLCVQTLCHACISSQELKGIYPLFLSHPEVPLLQLIHRISKRLLVGLDVAPDVAIALVTGGLAGVINAFGFGELA
jgi:hypothetical protein